MKSKLLYLFLLAPILLFAQEESQTFLSLKQTGVEEFLQKYPEFDGRGTIVLVMDSGVDMGLDGLKKTSTGEIKVIDAQDFSRQGNINYYEADTDEIDDVEYFVNEAKGFKVAGVNKLSLKPIDGDYFIGLMEEKLFLNSSTRKPDINENGRKDDKFYFVTFKTSVDGEEYWVVYFDKNADGDLSDETPLRNYKDQLEPFFIERGNGVPYLTFALNVIPDKQLVSFYFDDNGHGTNCAGIATGYRIGEADFKGVAPGANLIGAKIGNNEYSGGATVTESMKQAYEYADKLSKEIKQPIIINMSYGIGSEIETHAEMEIYLNNLVRSNSYLYICKSAGNDGPGISTLGQPSAATLCIVSGAALTKEVAGDLYGVRHTDDTIYAFSGRGAEVDKPDIVSPGGSFATIPNHKAWDGMQGTSMSSPYTAGVVSLLLSGVVAKYPEVKVPSTLINKVLRESATWMKGYDHLDQGGGMINVMKAWDVLEDLIKKGEVEKFETYSTSAFAPNMPGNSAPALYIRNGSYLTGKEFYRYTIERENSIKKDKFYRVVDIKSDSEWLLPAQKRTHFRNEQKAYVDVQFDISKMTEPGLYNGKIYATRQGSKIREFELMATVVIPYEFNAANNYKMKWKDTKLKPVENKRYFVNVPAGATSMKIDLTVEENEYGMLTYSVYDPNGRERKYSGTTTSFKDEDSNIKYLYDPMPGVWEVVVVNRRYSSDISEYNLSIEFDGINRIGTSAISTEHSKLEVVNLFSEMKTSNLSADIQGYQTTSVKKIAGYDELLIPFTIKKDEREKIFEIMLSKEDFNKNTDFAYLIYNEAGKSVAGGGLGYQDGTVSLNYKEGYENEKFTLKIVPGFVSETDEAFVHITEKVYFDNDIKVTVTNDGSSKVNFYPSVMETLELDYKKVERELPEGVKLFGNLYFQSGSSNETEYILPLKYKL
ncbi:MAG: S8 family serine peptidase [Bacteroidetes bacterium]|nr:S8 family serine peptidase [Bacteroidota bacterium]